METLRWPLRATYSICPVCHRRIPAQQVQRDGQVFLEKHCEQHGAFSTVIWRNRRDLQSWRGAAPAIRSGENEQCPHACGLCPSHLRDTCCTLLEVTKRCNLHCTFCFAQGEQQGEDRPFEQIVQDLHALAKPGQTLVQLSGGEPTVRDDLPAIVHAARGAGCRYVQLNTNGIRLAQDQSYVAALKEAGLSFVFMQFDGVDDEVYCALRNQPLFALKRQAIANCAAYNLGVTLVPTLVPGVNTHQVGDILRFAVQHAPAVRGVHFQPVSYFGRTPHAPTDAQRYTLDELLYALYAQTVHPLPQDSLRPSCCDHPLCGFHGDYVVLPDGALWPLQHATACCDEEEPVHACCEEPAQATQYSCCGNTGKPMVDEAEKVWRAAQNRAFVARRWERVVPQGEAQPTEPLNPQDWELEAFLQRVHSHGFTVTSMAFQDAWNLDLERLRQCSLHVYEDGRFVPFCAYYIGLGRERG